MNRLIFSILLSWCFCFTVNGQKKYSNFSIGLYKGNSYSLCTLKNPIWLAESSDTGLGKGFTGGLEINQRIINDFWMGIGMQFNSRNYFFQRVDPYLSGNIKYYNRTDYSQDFSLKIEYLKKIQKYSFSGIIRQKSEIRYAANSRVSSGSNITMKHEGYFLPSGVRPRFESGIAVSRYFGKRELISLKLEGNYSFFSDVRNSENIDKMNVISYEWKISFVKNFAPIQVKE